jgi:hypothetical protein
MAQQEAGSGKKELAVDGVQSDGGWQYRVAGGWQNAHDSCWRQVLQPQHTAVLAMNWFRVCWCPGVVCCSRRLA